MFIMDFFACDLAPQSEYLASLEELYTDFDEWLEKFRKFVLKRCQELNQNTTASRLTEGNLHLQKMIIHGIFLQKVPLRDYIMKDINSYYKMCSKEVTDSFINSPWGKIAFISWGNPENPPILLMHGYLDTAATFTFLVEKLPDTYYYVGVDIPGHGKSEPLPPGLLITKLHVVEVIRLVVEHMKWQTFTFLSHSFSCLMGTVERIRINFGMKAVTILERVVRTEQFRASVTEKYILWLKLPGMLYNAFYPGRVKNIIFLDPAPALAWYYVINNHKALWYKLIYNDYYDNYEKLNFSKPKSQSFTSWINSVSRTRKLTKGQSEVVLSRSFVPIDNINYQLSWEQRVKHLAHVELPIDTLNRIMYTLPPTLVINASEYVQFVRIEGAKSFAENLLKKCQENVSSFHIVTVTGSHDFHITNPDCLVEQIENFLRSHDKYRKKSKL